MSQVSIEKVMPEKASTLETSRRRFEDLRGVQWRIDLGILPCSPSSSIDDLRRVAANSRRRYAALRRQLLVDPHISKDGSSSPDEVMDNPLSQSPDSMWGRFFRNAELERMLDQDLTRLYPERSTYFQTTGCQGMLRRILLLWCLGHPECGYRQGMHELLAPLLYVLHVDIERLAEVRKAYEDHFVDKFDGFSFHENDLTYKFDFKKFSESIEDGNGAEKGSAKVSHPSVVDPTTQTIILLSDAYGAEGELGIVLSEKFMEHDAYSMFDALMSGAGGAVAMIEFFSPSPFGSSHSGIPPVIEASAAFYHLLSMVDASLHSHLVELEVEPQYFALRWLRVLFGREFSLENLLIIWDEIFACENTKFNEPTNNDAESIFGVLHSPRGAFISAFAVSMMLHLRSSLLATENATKCLQRLLNFPDDVDLVKLVSKAKSLQALAVDVNNSTSQLIHPGLYDRTKPVINKGHSLPVGSTSPRTPLNSVPVSYWEERWRVLHDSEESKKGIAEKQVPRRKNGWSQRVRLRLSRTESDPSPSNVHERKRETKPSVRRSLLKDLARQLGADEDTENIGSDVDSANENGVENEEQVAEHENFGSAPEPRHSSESAESDANSSTSSDAQIPIHGDSDPGNDSEKSSVASNILTDENDSHSNKDEPCGINTECLCPDLDSPDGISQKCVEDNEYYAKKEMGVKDRKLLSGKFQWLWKFGRNSSEGTSERVGASGEAKACCGGIDETKISGSVEPDGHGDSSSIAVKKETVGDQNLMVSLRNLGHSMLENIQVVESVFQQDRGQVGTLENMSKNGLVGKGQVTAVAALKELRKISNILSEM